MMKTEKLVLTQEWDKTFPKSEKVDHCKVTFVNRYGITLAADMYLPKKAEGKLPAIAVCGPFGAVKEQCSGLYAQTMAERGFLTISPDIWHLLISIRRISRRRWISCLCTTELIRSVLVSSASVAGVVSR